MLFTKKHLVVAITTSNSDMLRISVPWLRRFFTKVVLVIHNNNPEKTVKRSFVRKLGWRGKLHVINAETAIDELGATVAIIDFVEKQCPNTRWMTFVGDGDVLLSADIPAVSENAFAFVQNATTISGNVSEFLKINKKWVSCTDCGVTGPHFDLNGTWIRFEYMRKFRDFLIPLLPQASKITKKIKHNISISPILWQGLNTFVHDTCSGISALYMNKTNYVAVRLGADYDNAAAVAANKTANLQFNDLFRYGISQNVVASEQ